MAQTIDYKPIVEDLTKERVNDIIKELKSLSGSLTEMADIKATLAIIDKQISVLTGIVPDLSSLTKNVTANDISTVDNKYGSTLSSKYISAVFPIHLFLYKVPGVEDLDKYIVNNLSMLDTITFTLAPLTSGDGADRTASTALTSLDPKTAIDLYLTLYARKMNLIYLRDKMLNNLRAQLDDFINNLRQANE